MLWGVCIHTCWSKFLDQRVVSHLNSSQIPCLDLSYLAEIVESAPPGGCMLWEVSIHTVCEYVCWSTFLEGGVSP